MSLAALLINCECSFPARVAVPVGRTAVGGDATDEIMRLKLSGRKGPTCPRDWLFQSGGSVETPTRERF